MKPILSLFTAVGVFASLFFAHQLQAQPTKVTTERNCLLTWQSVSVPSVGDLHAVEALTENDVWVGGTGDLMHWNGESWNKFANPILLANPIQQTIYGIAGAASNDVWAVGSYYDSEYHAFILHWNGQQWEKVLDLNGQLLVDAAVLSSKDAWAVGTTTLHWDGTSWSSVALNLDETIFLSGVTASSTNAVWAVGKTGDHLDVPRIVYWDGTRWNKAEIPSGNMAGYRKAANSAPDNVWAVGYDFGNPTAIRWDGASWARHDPPGHFFRDIATFAADDVYAIGSGIMHWDGQEWALASYTPSTLNRASILKQDDIWAVGDYSTVMRGTLPCAEPIPNTPTPPPATPEPTAQATAEACSSAPKLSSPKNQAQVNNQTVLLKWQAQACASEYKVLVRKDSRKGKKVVQTNSALNQFTTHALQTRHDYHWRIRACNTAGCSKWSEWRMFYVKP